MTKSSFDLSRKAVAAAIGATLGVAATSASAQPQDRRATQIEEVVVTARRVEESLQDTPVSVAAFSTQELEQLGVSEAGDVANFTPNLTMRKQAASNDNYAIAIRGVSSGETALAIDPTVGIYQDGVYIARTTGAAFDIVDLKRIEVLRGPQGTLFGRNTIGGAINVITEKPRGEFHFQQKVGYGDEDYRNFRTTVDTPKMGDFAAKLSFLRNSKDGERTSIYTGDDLGENEATAYRLAVNWSPTDTLSVDYAYDKSDRNSNGSTQQLTKIREWISDPVSVDPDGTGPQASGIYYGGPFWDVAAANTFPTRMSQLPVRNSDGEETNSDIDGHAITVEWDIAPSLTMKSITSYREWESKARSTDFGSFAVPAIPGTGGAVGSVIDPATGPITPGTVIPVFSARRDSSQHQWTQEFQFVGTAFDERLKYNGGLYYFEEKADEFNPQTIVIPTAIATGSPCSTDPNTAASSCTSLFINLPFFDYATDNQSYAVYGQFTYTLLTDLDVTLGYRYSVDKKETTLTNNLKAQPGDAPVQTPTTASDNDDWSKFTPSLTVDYRWNEQLSTYVKYATGYRSGGYNVRSDNIQDFKQPFDEETITSYEIGWKSDLLNRKLRINGAVFYMEYEDRQIVQFSAGSGGASTRVVNAGESNTTGLELEVVWLPVTGLKIAGSYGYLDIEYDEFITGRLDPVTGFPTGTENEDIADTANENLYAPEQKGSLSVEYQFAPWDFGQLTLRVDSMYTDEISFHAQFDRYDESDEHTLLNARATLSDIRVGDDGVLRVSAWGKNLENKHFRDFGIDFGSVGITTNTYHQLRSWGLDFVYEYN